MKYRVAILCFGQVTGYWCGGSTHWTTDPSRVELFPDRASAEAQADETARWVSRANVVIEEVPA